MNARYSKPRRKTVFLFVLAIVAVFLALTPAIALADESPYYGYNYLSPYNPNECWSGCAWSGFNYWDWNGMHKNSGDCVDLAFMDTFGFVYFPGGSFCSGYNGTNFHVTRSGLGAPQYNRGLCQWASGNSSYVQCWMELF